MSVSMFLISKTNLLREALFPSVGTWNPDVRPFVLRPENNWFLRRNAEGSPRASVYRYFEASIFKDPKSERR